MVEISITPCRGLSPSAAPVEIVERKGTGHPDTMCDALAEELSLALSRFYRDHFGLILHHNVDKALLWGGASRAEFNGGRVLKPMEFFLAGRATCEYKGVKVPVEELLIETSRLWLKNHMHALDAVQDVKFHAMIRPDSSELVDLYLRQQKNGVPLANDTSCGVGFAPMDELEQVVFGVERHLNSAAVKAAHPAIGEDIKVMGVRQGDAITLTVACALVDRHIASIEDYFYKKTVVAELVEKVAQGITRNSVSVNINTADGEDKTSLYLTVTGTSAEAGDDGEVGRGNRVNGLITPYRPMNMEAAAGKNPVTHVGKLYNIAAQELSLNLVNELPEVVEAQCYLVSRIGYPIHEPQVVDLRLQLEDGVLLHTIESRVKEITHAHLASLSRIQDKLVEGAIKVY